MDGTALPENAEEAAALLGAAISADSPISIAANSPSSSSNTPQGMHSIFSVQSPLPNQLLFARLCNLRAWLRWHADAIDDPLIKASRADESGDHLGISFPRTKERPPSGEPFPAARSILAVLMKLLEASSNIASSGTGSSAVEDAGSKFVKSLSPKPKQRKHSQQHKPLAPLLSTPIRSVWAECVTLCVALGCNLQGNLRIDVNALINKLTEISTWNSRSRMAAGGVRLAVLQVLGQVCSMNTDLSKRTAPYAWEILQCCHKGLLSGGAGEPGHRAFCVQTASQLMVACRNAARSSARMTSSGEDTSFFASGALEERVANEVMKFAKRAASDKYPEVRLSAAVFAGLAAPMLIRNARVGRARDGDLPPLGLLEDMTQLSMKNIDDESAGVATTWSATLARCLCASSEYGKGVNDSKAEEHASRRSADVGDDAIVPENSMDLASKLKAFSGSRRGVVVTTSCSSVPATLTYLVGQFVKSGGETAANKCGGSFSIGGRATRIGYSDTIIEFLRLQSAKGDYSSVVAMPSVLEMVGASFDNQIKKKDGGYQQLLRERDFYSPSSPHASPSKANAKPTLSASFLNMNSKASATADSSIGRILTACVLRNISQSLSESDQHTLLREMISLIEGGSERLTRHQLQVLLIEISHLVIALGENCASSLADLIPALRDCLTNADHGVRHEAAAAFASISNPFPSSGRVFVIEALGSFGASMDSILGLSQKASASTSTTPRKRFGRPVRDDKRDGSSETNEELLRCQASVHGNSLAVSMLMHEFPHTTGGVATAIVGKSIEVINKLLQCQFDDNLVKLNPSAACTCIRAGYCMLAGVLSMGIAAVVPCHVSTVFGFWQSSSMNILPGKSKFSGSHDLLWVETMLGSVVSFLKFSPDLLLAVPEALNRITALLEKIFPLLSLGGRFEREVLNDRIGASRLSSARSSVLEAYSWLPPGSFPMSADRIYSFAVSQIQDLSSKDVMCSLIDSLVSREDQIIEAQAQSRAVCPGQIGGCVSLDNNLSLRSSDIMHHNEREAVLHILAWKRGKKQLSRSNPPVKGELHDSPVLDLYLGEEEDNSVPTPLHQVGTWRRPLDPTAVSRVRLLDCSIHLFAATFGLQDSHTQADAMKMLESMYSSGQTDKAKGFNAATLINESQGKVKPLEEDVLAANATATVLACLQALPLHESTHNTLISQSAPWMERSTSLLLRLLPSPSGIIRRAAAEGLSLLATLGTSEDAHTLQSTILHSLDEVMKGNRVVAETNPKLQLDTLAHAKAGSLLALACIQRAAMRIKRKENERLSRSVARGGAIEGDNNAAATPVMIMMTRVLPTLATHNMDEGSLLARTYALHAFGILISNSIDKSDALTPEQTQIISKAVEAVESNFLSAWSSVVAETSKGKEREKFGAEPSLLAVLLRLMTTLLPWIGSLSSLDRFVASRFACYVSTIIEFGKKHPLVWFEAMVFYERLSAHQNLLQPNSCCIVTTESPAALALPSLATVLRDSSPKVIPSSEDDFTGCEAPLDVQRAAIGCLHRICAVEGIGTSPADAAFVWSFFHQACGRRRFQHFSDLRSLALSRAITNFDDCQLVESETISLIQSIFASQWGRSKTVLERSYLAVQWILFCRCMAAGDTKYRDDDNYSEPMSLALLTERALDDARQLASRVLKSSNPPRWQLKCLSTNVGAICLAAVVEDEKTSTASTGSIFDLRAARKICSDMMRNGGSPGVGLHALPAFFLEPFVNIACSASTATSNNSELPSVQAAGLRLMTSVTNAFAAHVDPEDGSRVLSQYLSQIISSVRHGLNAESLATESTTGSSFHLLFSSGCDALYALLARELIADPVVMRRLVQPVLSLAADSLYVSYPEDHERDSLLLKTTHVTGDSRTFPLFDLSKLCFIAKVTVLVEQKRIQHTTIEMINNELPKTMRGLVSHSAAASIDGFFLDNHAHGERETITAGLTYKDRSDLDESVIRELRENWPILCVYSMLMLIESIKAERDECKGLSKWMTSLVPLIFNGFRSSLASQSCVPETSALCLYALRLLVQNYIIIEKESISSSELGDIGSTVTEIIFEKLGLSPSKKSACTALTRDRKVIEQACGLIEDMCQSDMIGVNISILTRAAVEPLAAIQEKRVAIDKDTSPIIASSLRSTQHLLLSHPDDGKADFTRALIQIALEILQESNELDAPSLDLLKCCVESSALPNEDGGLIASYTAAHGLWRAWAVVCAALPPGYGISCSITGIKSSLGDLEDVAKHVSALTALRAALQNASANDPALFSIILQSVGFEILQLLRAYSVRILNGSGFDDNRVVVCTEAVRVNLMAFTYLSSAPTEEAKVIAFVSTLFSILIESVAFNGYPNHPSGKVGADEAIGRMSAQVFVHVLRSSPGVFKSTMLAIPPDSRSVLEASVRADMNGYKLQQGGKKKLSLKGFQR